MLIKTNEIMTQQDWLDARLFCLKTIKEVYGFEYRADWHDDLDAMLRAENIYKTKRQGAFVLVRGDDGSLMACGGLRSLATKPGLAKQFQHRYPAPEEVGGLWRAYVAAKHRQQGLGTIIKYMRIMQARQLGYSTLYLHASHANPTSVAFGQKFGFTIFQEDPDGTVHMDKRITL